MMGILSDLFGQGRAHDTQQDARLDELFSRVLTLEQGSGAGSAEGGLTQTTHALYERLAELEQELADVRALVAIGAASSSGGDDDAGEGITLPEIK